MPNDYLAFLLVFIALVGVACLPGTRWTSIGSGGGMRMSEP